MSMNIKTFISYDRTEFDKNGRKIHIWRKTQTYFTKQQVFEARKNKEQMNLKVN